MADFYWRIEFLSTPTVLTVWWGQIQYPGRWKGWALKIWKSRLFWAQSLFKLSLPKWHSLCSLPFQGPKSLDFQGPPLSIVLGMDLPASKSFAPYKTTGTLIVIFYEIELCWHLHEGFHYWVERWILCMCFYLLYDIIECTVKCTAYIQFTSCLL